MSNSRPFIDCYGDEFSSKTTEMKSQEWEIPSFKGKSTPTLTLATLESKHALIGRTIR